jgi:hypothetical protein
MTDQQRAEDDVDRDECVFDGFSQCDHRVIRKKSLEHMRIQGLEVGKWGHWLDVIRTVVVSEQAV